VGVDESLWRKVGKRVKMETWESLMEEKKRYHNQALIPQGEVEFRERAEPRIDCTDATRLTTSTSKN